MKNGEQIKYYKNGNIYIISYYIDDKRNGCYKKYHENGELCSIYNYINDNYINDNYINDNYINDKNNGICKEYYNIMRMDIK